MFGRGEVTTDDPSVVRCGSCGTPEGPRRQMVYEYDVMVVGGPAKVRCLRCYGDAADLGRQVPVRFG